MVHPAVQFAFALLTRCTLVGLGALHALVVVLIIILVLLVRIFSKALRRPLLFSLGCLNGDCLRINFKLGALNISLVVVT